MIRSTRGLAYLCVATACVGWAFGPISLRLLRETYDAFTAPFVRYAVATVPLVAVSLIWHRRDFMALMRRPGALCALALINILAQLAWTSGTYGTTATTALLISKTDTVFVILLAYFLFHEERGFIRHPAFLVGAFISMAGVAAVFASDPSSRMPTLDRASILIVITAFIWAVYSVWAKHLVKNIHPIPLFTVVALYTALGFVFIAFAFGDPGAVLQADGKTLALTLVSGVIPLSISYPCFNYAQKHLGASFCSIATLFTPVCAYVFSFVVLPEETLLPVQIAGAMVLIAGTFVVTVAHYRVTAKGRAGDPISGPDIAEAEAS